MKSIRFLALAAALTFGLAGLAQATGANPWFHPQDAGVYTGDRTGIQVSDNANPWLSDPKQDIATFMTAADEPEPIERHDFSFLY